MPDRKPIEFTAGSSTFRWKGPGRGVELGLPWTNAWYKPAHPDVAGPFATLAEARRAVERLLAR